MNETVAERSPAPGIRSIRLREWESKEYRLSLEDVAALSGCKEQVLKVQILPGGVVRLTAGPYAGHFRCGSLDVVVQPKSHIPSLMQVLTEVYELRYLLPKPTGYRTTDNLVDLLVEIFLHQVAQIVRQGLKRSYIEENDELVAIRGRIDLRRTCELHMRAQPRAWCAYEDFITDTIENRALLATLSAIEINPGLLQLHRRLARKLSADFAGVQKEPLTARDVAGIVCDRVSAHYQPVLRLASVILEGLGLANDIGELETCGFLVNMNLLFESFVYKRLQKVLHTHGITVRPQLQFPFDEDSRAKIIPDLLARSQNGRRVILDTKYKNQPDPDRADLYQMLSYCRVLHVSEGILVTVGQRSPQSYRVRDGTTTIHIVPVDLGGSPVEISGSIGRLAQIVQGCMETRTAAGSDHLSGRLLTSS